jgi:CBS domain-containing protein
VVRHEQVAQVAAGRVQLNCGEKALETYAPNEAWLAVRKDLLDQQIIDTSGRKVVRVNDIDLVEQRSNGSVELRVVQADVGLTGAARRLLQGLLSPEGIRRLQQKLPAKLIPWEFVNLVESDPLRRIKLRLTHDKLENLHPADLADIMEQLSASERHAIIASLDEETAAAALAELDARLTTQIVEKLDPEKAADILEEMAPDAAADVLAELTPETSKELLDEMTKQEGQEVRGLLQFDENTAGGMMNPDFIFVGEIATRDEVVDWIRSKDLNLDQLDAVVLINDAAEFSGIVPVSRLLLGLPDQPVGEMKLEPLLSVEPSADDKEVFEIFDKYNLRALTVVNDEKRPIGAITVDDVVSRLVKQL